MQKKIIRRTVSMETVPYTHQIHPLLARIYAARGVRALNEVDYTFAQLLPYELLLGIEEAAQLLATAVMQQKKILIVGDFDADGATATVVAVRALRALGAQQVGFLVPNRFSDGYGLTPALVHAAARLDEKPDLIITVDNGISSYSGVLLAKEYGMQVIITDHHLPASSDLPKADAIVNPNQPGDSFASKALAGVGVIFYLMCALRSALLLHQWFDLQCIAIPNLANLLDLVALGTVADLVPLDQNNRILVQQGLRRIRAGHCVPGILALLSLSQRDYKKIVAADLGFAVAARLNAAGRLDDMSLGIHCLLSDKYGSAEQKAKHLDTLNRERRVIEQTMQIQALTVVDTLHDGLQRALPRGICLFDPSWHQGVIGILASRIKDRFHRPVIIFAPANEKELKGSARSIPGFHMRDALAQIAAKQPQWILKFGGHAMAAGLSITRECLTEFTQMFDSIVSEQLEDWQLERCFLSDGALEPEEFNVTLAKLLREAGPFGQTFPEPLFDGVFNIVEQRLVGTKHLKLKLSLEKNSTILDAIAFFIDDTQWPNYRCHLAHIAYRLDINDYQQCERVQLIVEHLQPIVQ